MNQRVCTVRGLDFRGYPVTVIVEAYSVFEAAARAMEEIRKAGGAASTLHVTVHAPGKQWQVTPDQLARWAASSSARDNVGLRTIKNNLRAFLNGAT